MSGRVEQFITRSTALTGELDSLRHLRGWSMRELAERAGVSYSSVRILRNPDSTHRVSKELCAKVLDALVKDPEEGIRLRRLVEIGVYSVRQLHRLEGSLIQLL
ncbi:MAG: helix-turn-helix transcriptional regulator [Candidatus Daviesbacteria bacterium]|nr:helix-turn-helix transcriptional regulator [Candidatus Daviesbacteria bacterium]